MRTTITIDDDVAALIEAERRRTGETFRDALNRLLRRAVQRDPTAAGPPLPLLPGKPKVDVRDVSQALGQVEDEYVKGRRLY